MDEVDDVPDGDTGSQVDDEEAGPDTCVRASDSKAVVDDVAMMCEDVSYEPLRKKPLMSGSNVVSEDKKSTTKEEEVATDDMADDNVQRQVDNVTVKEVEKLFFSRDEVNAIGVLMQRHHNLIDVNRLVRKTISSCCSESLEMLLKKMLLKWPQFDLKRGDFLRPYLWFAIDQACHFTYGNLQISGMKSVDEVIRPFRVLLDHGADVNTRYNDGRLVLHYVAESKSHAAPRLIEMLLPRTIYDAEKEGKLLNSPMEEAIRHGCLDNLEVFLNYTNKSGFVVPNRERQGVCRFYGGVKEEGQQRSNLALMLDDYPLDCGQNDTEFEELMYEIEDDGDYSAAIEHPHFAQYYRIVSKMIEQGWSIKAEIGLDSPLFVSAEQLATSPTGTHLIFRPLLKLLVSKGATLNPIEARSLLTDYFQTTDNNAHLLLLLNWGIIPPEALLEVDPVVCADPTEKDGVDTFVISHVAYILIINDTFGFQGRYARKIENAIDFYTHHYRSTDIFEPGMDVMRQRLKMGSLKMQARTVIRSCLQENNFYHPWEMNTDLQSYLPVKALIDYVASIKVSVSDWTPNDSRQDYIHQKMQKVLDRINRGH